jgi:uncharacterized protein YjiS (DUF1127 family)
MTGRHARRRHCGGLNAPAAKRFDMYTTAHRSAGGFARASAALARTLANRLAATWRHRRDMALLAGLDERALADMGLTRTDIRDAVSQPLWRDPTAVLADRRSDRRRSDYRAVFTQLIRDRNSPSLAARAGAPGYPPTNRSPRLTV